MKLPYPIVYFLLSLIFIFGLSSQTKSQNYIDSVKMLVKQADTSEVSPFMQAKFDTAFMRFEQNVSDSFVVTELNNLTILVGLSELSGKLNGLLQRMCTRQMNKTLLPELKQHFTQQYAISLINEADVFERKGQLKEAITHYHEALALGQEMADTSLMVEVHGQMGNAYMATTNYEESERQFLAAVALEELRGEARRILRSKSKWAQMLIERGRETEAIPVFEEYLKQAEKDGDDAEVLNTEYFLGVAYQRLKNTGKAAFYLERVVDRLKKYNEPVATSIVLNELAQVALTENRLGDAFRYGSELQELADQHDLPQVKVSALEILSKVYEQKGEYKESLSAFKDFVIMDKELTGAERTRQLLEQQHQFESKQDSVQAEARLAVEVESRKFSQNIALTLWVIALLILVFAAILWNRFRITKKQKEQLDQANDELKALDETKSRFFTNISHEFRTPLTVISGIADMISEPEQKDLIKRNSHNLLNLVNQILDLSKLEANKLSFDMQQGNIIPYLKYLLESFQSYAESKNIDLGFHSETQELLMDFDADRINSIVTNLISNAIKFTPEGGKVDLFCVVKNEQFLIQVKDNGLGIPKDKIAHVFDRFYQVDDSNTRMGEGTGIGLTLSRDLVESFGGKMGVESVEGEGSQFTVWLPITRRAPLHDFIPSRIDRQREESTTVMLHPEEDGPVGEAPYRLLIVEDNADVVQYLQSCLSESYKLLIARDGQEGIDMAIAKVPDIILSDVMMPGKDGFELCQTLKTDDRTSHIPIVLLTARSDVESRISGLKHGADAYLPKPFERKELEVRLEMLLKLRERLQARYQSATLSANEADFDVEKEDTFIIKIRGIILDNLDDASLSVSQLCELAGMSRTQIHNKVRALTGKSTTHLLRQIRLNEARKLLKDRSLNIAEVAYRTGFNNPSYFTRMFVDEFGETPREHRKKTLI